MSERDKRKPLHTKYRPSSFEEFIGNDATVEALRTILLRTTGDIRSFLFIGPSGAGKTTLARIIGSILRCSQQDFYEYDSANTRGIDTIRDISNNSRYFPLGGKIKIYLLDECHKITNDAQNALLKLLEDPPKHTRFILCTTDPEKLIKTIKTRCTTFQVALLKRPDILKLLKWVCKEENVELGQNLLIKIANACEGSPRQALVILDQVIDIEDEELAIQSIADISVIETNTLELCRALLNKNNWTVIANIITNLDDDPEKIRYAILTYMTKVLLGNNNTDRAAQIIDLFKDSVIYSGKAGLTVSCYLTTKI